MILSCRASMRIPCRDSRNSVQAAYVGVRGHQRPLISDAGPLIIFSDGMRVIAYPPGRLDHGLWSNRIGLGMKLNVLRYAPRPRCRIPGCRGTEAPREGLVNGGSVERRTVAAVEREEGPAVSCRRAGDGSLSGGDDALTVSKTARSRKISIAASLIIGIRPEAKRLAGRIMEIPSIMDPGHKRPDNLE